MQALLGARAKESLDLRAHLKQVKKEDTEKVSVGEGQEGNAGGAEANHPRTSPEGRWHLELG